MIDLEVTIEDPGILRAIGTLGKSTARKVSEGLEKGARSFNREYQKTKLRRPASAGDANQTSATSGSSGRKWLYRRTGSLARALTHRSVRSDDLEKVEVRIGWIDQHSAMIATVHERGATIRPRRSKYLTIPLPAALTSAGVPKQASARDWPNTFVRKAIIFQKLAGGQIQPLYVLKKQVRIPPRLEFIETAKAFWMTGEGARILEQALAGAIEEA